MSPDSGTRVRPAREQVPDVGPSPEPSAPSGRRDRTRARRGMSFGGAVSEAWRNLRTGTTRAPLLALVLALLVGSLAAVDVRAVVSVVQGALAYRDAGASVHVLEAPGKIDGARCEALAGIDGVHAAGAVRTGESLRALNLPSSELTVHEATPGLLRALDREAGNGGGLWLSDDLADALGARPGDRIATTAGPADVAGVYPYPDDGRDRALAYAVVAPVPAAGSFDACWAEIWPVDETRVSYLRTALVHSPSRDQDVVQKQLNSRLGATYDASTLFAERLTRHAPVGAAVIGLALGLAAVRARRLELAASLHARVGRAALTGQVLLETLAWVTAAVVLATPVLGWLASWGNPAPAPDHVTTWLIGMRVLLAGAAAVVVGSALGALTTREKHLFRYFKER